MIVRISDNSSSEKNRYKLSNRYEPDMEIPEKATIKIGTNNGEL